MKYILRLFIYLVIFAGVYSVSAVVLLRFIPVTVTPLKVVRLFENFGERGFNVRSMWCPIGEISPVMMRAVIATEDNRFLEHRGFDWEAIEKAMQEYKKGGRLRGGSTITQQTAKNIFCLHSRTWMRKGIEAWFTTLIEIFWSKEKIMEVYLNVIETGENMYGVEAVAKNVYKKKASQLNAHEASMIATVLPNPLKMNLYAPSKYMVSRAAKVRGLMDKLGPLEWE